MTGDDAPILAMRSDMPGIEWPPVSRGQPAVLAAMLGQLEATQWMAPGAIETMQYRQLGVLADHGQRFSPQFRRRLEAAGLKPSDLVSPEGLRRLPILRRRELQSARDLYCEVVPQGHTPVFETRTSGSTGEPVVVRRTAVSSLDWLAMTLREYLWHRRDFRKPVCSIRPTFTELTHGKDWGPPASLLFETGPSLGIPITADIDQQIRWIDEFRPDLLSVYPSNLAALVRGCVARGVSLPGLRHVYCIGETLPPALRAEAAQVLGVRVTDCYSSQEVGSMAFECPDSALYHVMAEAVIVEVLDADGAPCGEGRTGRVTVTDLHNFATPLIRYDIGDYAEVGPACPCGRGLPTLRRIHGRERNLILMPDGSRHWPLVGFNRFREIAPVIQYQLIQDGRETIELRLVADRTLTAGEEAELAAHIQASLGFPFALRFVYFEGEIPAGAGGKFEEFVCRVG